MLPARMCRRRDNNMSKRIILIGIAVILLAGAAGAAFWFVRNRSSATPPDQTNAGNGSVASGSGIVSDGTGLVMQANPPVQGGGSGAVSNAQAADSVPQLVLPISDQPQNPMVVYQGKTMTQEEYKQAWAASTTKKNDAVLTTPSSTVKTDPISDADRDGLMYDQEMKIGTDPNNADTDGDGLSDGKEVNEYKTNPKNFDTDNDGLTDGEETGVYKTDPTKADTDGDSYTDGTEVRGGYNPSGPGKLKP